MAHNSQKENRTRHRSAALIGAVALLWAALTALVGCVPGPNDHSEFQSIPDARWAYGDTLLFVPQLTDSVATGVLTVSLRHGNEYVYSNLWIEATYHDAAGRLHRDTLDLVLADKYGKWRGRGMGTSYQTTDTLARRLALLRSQPEVTLRHVMRRDTVEGIYEVGIEFKAD